MNRIGFWLKITFQELHAFTCHAKCNDNCTMFYNCKSKTNGKYKTTSLIFINFSFICYFVCSILKENIHTHYMHKITKKKKLKFTTLDMYRNILVLKHYHFGYIESTNLKRISILNSMFHPRSGHDTFINICMMMHERNGELHLLLLISGLLSSLLVVTYIK